MPRMRFYVGTAPSIARPPDLAPNSFNTLAWRDFTPVSAIGTRPRFPSEGYICPERTIPRRLPETRRIRLQATTGCRGGSTAREGE